MADSQDAPATNEDISVRLAKQVTFADTEPEEKPNPPPADQPDSDTSGSTKPPRPKKEEEEDAPVPLEWVEGQKKKKKSKPRPKSKRGKNKPTGFEDWFGDAPMTPDEFEVEKELYDISRSPLCRMEDALLRYQKKRRIESDRREVFLKYLAYGGVDVSQNMFGGMDARDLKALDSEQILQARTQARMRKDLSHLTIDFDAVARGFLTSFFPYYFNPDTEAAVKLATVTIRNFLSYLLYHDVCPEYKENIDQARKSCDIAAKELWKNQQLMAKGPGNFNTACSTLFAGVLFDSNMGESDWENPLDDSPRMTNEVARKVVKFALAGAGSDTQARQFQEMANQHSLKATRVEDIGGFEITAVHPPDAVDCEFYKRNAPDLVPVGRLLAKSYRDPGQPEFDLSPEESLAGQPVLEFQFFLEGSLLQYCYPGMKVISPVWRMNAGFDYFEDVFRVYGSIYTVLANDLMLGWKEPKDMTTGSSAGESDKKNEKADDGDGSDSSVTL
ncbi:hypothetical protein BO70DRAFT_334877 [Aspergillus heteromorphus CBS 117.55]|uniref:Argonaute complex, subunit Arb1 n=1 Tax=Aspergillus heteromorphus CBS 117.55 TaxID=1448321 RepID=A0A317WI91_9EURO|nr:uncharacterized protein BO70DRAFT_334877 [Aspergillus heteromorphus CBS 117.55]PWY84887.1 hypothetical protein BO70DRAFT_334877 [Aspergillus heteromorphus CBS 117.55]